MAAVDLWNILVLSLSDFSDQLANVFTLEWILKITHFEEENTKSPNISLCIILLAETHFWREVVRCANKRLSFRFRVFQQSSYAKVTKFYLHVLAQKDVVRFNVSVDDIVLVNAHNCQTQLTEDIKDLFFIKISI